MLASGLASRDQETKCSNVKATKELLKQKRWIPSNRVDEINERNRWMGCAIGNRPNRPGQRHYGRNDHTNHFTNGIGVGGNDIDVRMIDFENPLTAKTAELWRTVEQVCDDLNKAHTHQQNTNDTHPQPTYSSVVLTGLPSSHYSTIARRTSRTRQVLIDEVSGTTGGHDSLTEMEIMTKANLALERMGKAEEGKSKFVGARRLKNGGILLEADRGEIIAALQEKGRKITFRQGFDGGQTRIRDRTGQNPRDNLGFVPIAHETGNKIEYRQIEDISVEVSRVSRYKVIDLVLSFGTMSGRRATPKHIQSNSRTIDVDSPDKFENLNDEGKGDDRQRQHYPDPNAAAFNAYTHDGNSKCHQWIIWSYHYSQAGPLIINQPTIIRVSHYLRHSGLWNSGTDHSKDM
ncbi:hypothetical protein EW146_g9339 [Bondarzewia mesenterica]|uniref:Uncharacterized protein n=1 Tax=Bondarzewia mesenterica TaxID=1095465 RepID=A0A4S4L7L1_9AGAM|nr:hypothetical protein EW146_g9339 [Bondarzewia mesenterica]